MSASKHVTIWCDDASCPEFVDHGEPTVARARTMALGEGWTHRGNRDLCTHHSKNCGRYCLHKDHLSEPRPTD